MSRCYPVETDEELEQLYRELSAAYNSMIKNNVQEYTIADRTLKRIDLAKIREELKDLAKEIKRRKIGHGVKNQRGVRKRYR